MLKNVAIPTSTGTGDVVRSNSPTIGSYFSGVAAGATTVYVTPGEGI